MLYFLIVFFMLCPTLSYTMDQELPLNTDTANGLQDSKPIEITPQMSPQDSPRHTPPATLCALLKRNSSGSKYQPYLNLIPPLPIEE